MNYTIYNYKCTYIHFYNCIPHSIHRKSFLCININNILQFESVHNFLPFPLGISPLIILFSFCISYVIVVIYKLTIHSFQYLNDQACVYTRYIPTFFKEFLFSEIYKTIQIYKSNTIAFFLQIITK